MVIRHLIIYVTNTFSEYVQYLHSFGDFNQINHTHLAIKWTATNSIVCERDKGWLIRA